MLSTVLIDVPAMLPYAFGTVLSSRVPTFLPVALQPLPPWLVLAGVLGVINAAACFMLIGRHLSRLAWYAVLGMFAASLGQVVSMAIQAPEPLKIGDVNVLAASLGACSVVLTARLRGL
jgi:hypothetical protein